jgi:hypothetical protein
MLRRHARASRSDLEALARRRAEAARRAILAAEKVDPQRVFVDLADPLSPEKEKGLSGSRITFRIRGK